MNTHAKIVPTGSMSQIHDPKEFLARHGVEIDDKINDLIRVRLSAQREGAEQAMIVHMD